MTEMMSEPKKQPLRSYFVVTPGTDAGPVYRSMVKAPMRPMYRSLTSREIAVGALSESEAANLADQGASVIPARQYQPVDSASVYQPLASHPRSLKDVLDHIRAPDAWTRSRGAGIDVAVIDTGVCGTMKEFPDAKKSADSWAAFGDPWSDPHGHGSMCAAIAAASSSDGGRYDGVAPDARIIACRTNLIDTEIFQIYEHLIQLIADGKTKRIVTNNSYGAYTCEPLGDGDDHPLVRVIRQAVNTGIVPVFAAGNNHVAVCGNDPDRCDPNTIWGINSLDEVITVGTVNENERMDELPRTAGGYSHRDSSRGPGEMAQSSTKPDCVAPTYGEVVWGCGYRSMEWWGTSGAAPQVAGLAALILSVEPALTVEEVGDRIRGACRDLGLAPTCAGRGIIDCEIAVR